MIDLIGKAVKSKIEHAYRLLFVNQLNRFVSIILITEYFKSGGTWLGQLVSSYLELPFPRNTFPAFHDSLLHSHYLPNRRFKRMRKILWLVRDGRDVIVSLYHHYLIWNDKNRLNPKDVYYHRSQVPFDDYEHVRKNLPAFIEYVFEHRPSKLQQFTYPGNWVKYNRAWLQQYRKGEMDILRVRYEDLLRDTEGELFRILRNGFGIQEPDTSRIREIVSYYSFENQTKRKQGTESKKSFLRKGISGDWKNYFDKESADKFDYYATDMLIELGYEIETEWTDLINV